MGRAAFHALASIAAFAVLLSLPVCAEHPCALCHPKEVAGYEKTPMAHALGPASEAPGGRFSHELSKTGFTVTWKNGEMVQRETRAGVSASHQMVYAIGSGTHAVGHLFDVANHLFQSPLTYYSERKAWGMSPGYEDADAPDFFRPVTPECLFCHSGRVRWVEGTLNEYDAQPFEAETITCERCHGPAEAHLRAPLPGTIVNPAKLPQRARDSICEQCHLAGEARVPNPGKHLSDFRPGMNLEDVFSVYVFDHSAAAAQPQALKVISQAQQLSLSKCARQSHGNLWCGTCHDPHDQPAEPISYYRSKCLSCHGTGLLASHPKPNDNCIGCHMPRRPVSDGGHTIFTDHRIARVPPREEEAPAKPDNSALPLIAWHDPPPELVQRNLGLADILVGERVKSVTQIADGSKLLLACWSQFPKDTALLSSLGQVLLGLNDAEEAAQMFERTIQIEPNVAANYLHAGFAWQQLNNPQKAIASYEQALQHDPLLEEAYKRMVQVYASTQQTARLRDTYERYLKAFPGNIEVQTAMANLNRSAQIDRLKATPQ